MTCWRVVKAARASFLVDAAAYFRAVRASMAQARRSILIVGWDVDSRVKLVPDRDEEGPAELLPFLTHVLERRPDLRVNILAWDYSVIYTFERAPLPAFQFRRRGHPRLCFELDDAHPVGASHHQKLVVVDDLVAFVGGLDLTIRRWDTQEHLAAHPDRVDPAGVPYAPIHDVQVAVDGEAARALGELARARWHAATGEHLHGHARSARRQAHDPWPLLMPPDLTDTPVGIARTMPAFGHRAPAREISALTLEAIGRAERTIYIENQYLTSAAVGDGLAARLADPSGPEVVIVVPREETGWLEQSSMGVMRTRVVERLRRADAFGRLRLYYPTVPGLDCACVNVHSKVMIVDDQLLRVGSANLSNRSMGLDTECDLAVEAGDDPRLRAGVTGLRDRLLGEHLGVAPAMVRDAVAANGGSLIRAVESLAGGARTLLPLKIAEGDAAVEPSLNLAMLDGMVCDPERPAPDLLMDAYVPQEVRRPLHRALLRWALAVAALLALAALWRLTPLRTYVNVETLAGLGRAMRGYPAAPLIGVAAYIVGAAVFFPITVMLGATALVFEPATGTAVALLGALGGATLGWAVGRKLGRRRVEWLAGRHFDRVRRHLKRRGMLAIAIARMLPVGNFSVINLAAGAFGIPLRDFVLGNAVGILPGTIMIMVFADRLGATLRRPSLASVLILLAIVAILLLVVRAVRRLLARRADRASQVMET